MRSKPVKNASIRQHPNQQSIYYSAKWIIFLEITEDKCFTDSDMRPLPEITENIDPVYCNEVC